MAVGDVVRCGRPSVANARWVVGAVAVAIVVVAVLAGGAASVGAGNAIQDSPETNDTPSATWTATYEPPRGQGVFRDAAPAPEGDGYLLVGTAGRTGSDGAYDGWLVRTGADGSVRWSSTLGGSNSDVLTSVVGLADGGYLVAGTRDSDNRFSPGKWWVVRLDSQGDMVWETVGDRGRVDGLATAPGGHAIAVGTGPSNGRVRRLAGNGTVLWEQGYAVDSVAAVARNGTWYVVVGQSSLGDAEAWAARLTADGETEWGEYYSTAGPSRFAAVGIDHERGWPYVAGRANTGSREQAPWFARLADDDGTMVWNRTLGNAGTRGLVYDAAAGWRGAVLASNEVPDGDRERGYVSVAYPSGNLSDRQRIGTDLRAVHRLNDRRALVAGADGSDGLAAVVRIDRVDPPEDDGRGDEGGDNDGESDGVGNGGGGTADDSPGDGVSLPGPGEVSLPDFGGLTLLLYAATAVAVVLALLVTALAVRDL